MGSGNSNRELKIRRLQALVDENRSIADQGQECRVYQELHKRLDACLKGTCIKSMRLRMLAELLQQRQILKELRLQRRAAYKGPRII